MYLSSTRTDELWPDTLKGALRASSVAAVFLALAATLLCAAAAWVWFLRRSTRPPLLFLSGLTVFAAFVVWNRGRRTPDGIDYAAGLIESARR